MEIKIGIIIVLFEGLEYFHSFVDFIDKNPNHEIGYLFVDNSTDISISDHRIFLQNPNVHLVTNDKNLGFGAANNIGVKFWANQGTNVVLLLNQDAIISTDVIYNMYSELMVSNKRIISCVNTDQSSTQVDPRFLNYLINSSEFTNIVSALLLKNSLPKVNYVDVEYVNAAIWMIKIQDYFQVGGFDPRFFHYGEDNYFCHKYSLIGGKVRVLLDCSAVHYREIDRKNNKTTEYNILANVTLKRLVHGRKKAISYALKIILSKNNLNVSVNPMFYFKLLISSIK